MTKYWLASAATVAMMMTTGIAFAESAESSTTVQSTTTVPAVPNNYSATHTERSVDENGVSTVKKKTYNSGSSGTSSSAYSKTVGPDGAEVKTYHEENSSVVPPPATTTTTKKSTTTTTTDE